MGVHDDRHAERLELLELSHGAFVVAEQQHFGDFEFEPIRLESTVVQSGGDDFVDGARFELRRRKIHRHRQMSWPGLGGAARFAEDPFPTLSISRMSSAIGMNVAGGMSVPSGAGNRTSASNPIRCLALIS